MKDEYIDVQIEAIVEQMSTLDEFKRVIHLLKMDCELNGGDWGNSTVQEFLGGVRGFCMSLKNYYANQGVLYTEGAVPWQVFARLLLSGRGKSMTDLFGDALVESAERISSREEFTAFAKALSDNLCCHPEEWQNATLTEFIRGLAGFVENMDGNYANIGADVNCNLPSWRVFADALLAARVYE